MKSTDFITEGFWDDDDVDDETDGFEWTEKEWLKIVKTVRRDCTQYLQQAKGQNLYRGIASATGRDLFLKKKVRLTDRDPKDMPVDIHNKLNQYFLMKHGAKFRNALFVSGDDMQASEYGRTYIIFPIGRFEFLWSPNIGDLYTEYEDYETYSLHKDFNKPKKEQEKINAVRRKENLKKFHDEVLVKGYTTNNLAQAIKSGNEIMLRCNSYYAIDSDSMDDLPREWKAMLK